jgi:hypothetical protein
MPEAAATAAALRPHYLARGGHGHQDPGAQPGRLPRPAPPDGQTLLPQTWRGSLLRPSALNPLPKHPNL